MRINSTLKRIICILLVLIMILCTASCGSSKPKKKVVIKKVIVTSSEEDSTTDNSDDFISSEQYEEDAFEEEQYEEDISEEEEYEDDVLEENESEEDESEEDESEEDESEEEFKFQRELPTKNKGNSAAYIPEFVQKEVNWDGPKGYVIVHKVDDKYANLQARYLQAFFKKVDGIELKIVTDASSAVQKEILVGDTNRYTTTLDESKFAVDLKGQKLVFEGGHRTMVEKAVKWFMSIDRVAGKVATLKGQVNDFKTELSGGYKLVWGDEFDGDFLDKSRFIYANHMGTGSSTVASDLDELTRVEDGLLKMTTKRVYSDTSATENIGIPRTICTGDTMQWLYGYAEIRALVPCIRGAWPAWWSTNYCQFRPEYFKFPFKYVVEVDFFEVFGDQNVTPNIHKWYEQSSLGIMTNIEKDGKPHTHSDYNVTFGSISHIMGEIAEKEFHTFGFKWTPDKMTLSVDGGDYMSFDLNNNFDGYTDMSHFKDTPLHMILNNFAYYDSSKSNCLNVKDLPFNFFIDYVRIYQRDGEGYIKDFGLDKEVTY